MIKEKYCIIILSILLFIFSYISINYRKNYDDNLWDKIPFNEENAKIANLTNYNKQIVKIHSKGVILDGLILIPKKQNNYKAIVLL